MTIYLFGQITIVYLTFFIIDRVDQFVCISQQIESTRHGYGAQVLSILRVSGREPHKIVCKMFDADSCIKIILNQKLKDAT